MYNITKITLVLLLFLCVPCKSHSQLNIEQKIQDFDHLFQTLEENYPYFGVAKRQSNNWLSKKSEYLELIKNSSDDFAYFVALQYIVSQLNCPHLHVVFPNESMLDGYRRITLEYPKFAKWVEVLEKSKEQSLYWQKILEDNTGQTRYTPQLQVSNYSDSILDQDKIAIMRIKSFLYDNLANDSVRIISFLKKIQDYDYLIIDIQDNGGGSDNYWGKYIVGKISDIPITFPRTQVSKNGSLNKEFYPEIEKWNIATKENTSFPNLPDEILDGSYFIHSYTDTIMPNNPIPFKGKIYVLVNYMVVSASEDFAYFCKAAKWATIAGTRTMGDGNCADPILFMLPNSGITVTHPSIAGLNEDGSFNFETRTIPNLVIEAENSDERLDRLIKHIKTVSANNN